VWILESQRFEPDDAAAMPTAERTVTPGRATETGRGRLGRGDAIREHEPVGDSSNGADGQYQGLRREQTGRILTLCPLRPIRYDRQLDKVALHP
jgi:hypothetical protein